nr:MAG TPA: hypothetical protein [Caudoviricetes sp.]
MFCSSLLSFFSFSQIHTPQMSYVSVYSLRTN